LRLFDKTLSDEEWQIVENLVQFLKIFRSATEVLRGATYPTISLVLLFRDEIAGALTESPNDSQIVKSIKYQMLQDLDYRLPVMELHVAAAVLDPFQRNLNALQEYLSELGMTAIDLLSWALQQYVGDSAASLTVDNPQTTDDGNLRPWKKKLSKSFF